MIKYFKLYLLNQIIKCLGNTGLVGTIDLKLDDNEGLDACDINAEVDKRMLQNYNGSGYTCAVCGKIMVKRSHMIQHIETHLDLLHTCDICQRQYKSRNSLCVHKSTAHKHGKM